MEHEPEIVRHSLLWVHVCVPKTYTDMKVEQWINEVHPTGIRSRWAIDRNQEQVRCQCNDHEGKVHIVLVC
ncbi:hypothetical protein D3C76_283680 [compost metagenome]